MRCMRRLPFAVLAACALGAVLVVGCFYHDGGKVKSLASSLRRRKLSGESSQPSPTASPTRTPIRISIDTFSSPRNSDLGDPDLDSPSNDGEVGSPDPTDANGGGSASFSNASRSDNKPRRLAIIAVCLAAVFALLMCTLSAMVWRKYLWHSCQSVDQDELEEHGSGDPMNRHRNVPAGSILRSKAPSPGCDEAGRRVRFHLPGSSSSGNKAAVLSTEHDEDSSRMDTKSPQAKSKKVKISVESDINIGIRDGVVTLPLASGVQCVGASKSSEDGEIAKPPTQNDPETWVARIMHPWLDSPLCCPDDCDTFGVNHQKPATHSLLDQLEQSTIATNSFESTTPMLPPFPSSTYDSKYGDEEAAQEEKRGVLGIQSRREDPADALVLEEVVANRKRTREKSPPPCNYGREEGEEGAKPKSLSAWRKKAWHSFEGKRKRNAPAEELCGTIDDDIDIESFSEYGNFAGGRSGQLVEI